MRNKPRIRFKGFTEDWEQRKLKVIANTIVAGGDIDKDKIKENGTYPVIANALTKDGIVGYYDDDYRIEAPAVTITGRGDIGIAKARHQNFTPVVRLLSLTTVHDVDFVEHAINNLRIVSESTGVPQLTVPQLSNYKIHITSIHEEKKIGLFISKLDNFITLHQRKLEKLKLAKKALLQKLFPKNGSQFPEIRFKGFTDAWEQRKLSEVVTINPKTELPDKFKYVDLESVVGTNLLGFQVIKKENAPSRAQRLASYGDVFYQTVRPYQRNNYLFENIDKDMVFSTGYAQLRSKLDNYFLLTLVQNDNFVKVVLDNCTGTSYPAINGSELGKITVQIPSNDAEANQIGKVFRGIDNIITLHQRKLDRLQEVKIGLLQKMFV